MELEQLMARPQATIYCINLPDYSLPGFVSGDKPYCQMFVVEKTFANASEAVQDITGFTGEALLSEFFNDIFGDG